LTLGVSWQDELPGGGVDRASTWRRGDCARCSRADSRARVLPRL